MDDEVGIPKQYENLDRLYKNRGIPPKGAFVLYDYAGPIHNYYKNLGHVGLSLWDGNIIHAWDEVRIDNYMAVENLKPDEEWSNAKYIRWIPMDSILILHEK